MTDKGLQVKQPPTEWLKSVKLSKQNSEKKTAPVLVVHCIAAMEVYLFKLTFERRPQNTVV